MQGVSNVETMKPIENTPAVTPLDHLNSLSIGGKRREKEVRAFTAIAIVKNATNTTIQP